MGPELVGGELHGVGELHELAGQHELLRRLGRCGAGDGRPRGVEARLAKDRAHARHRVEQVGRGVAIEREHLVPRKDVVARAVLREIGVLHGADADGYPWCDYELDRGVGTTTRRGDWQAGGGLVYDSVPEAEYQETVSKAMGMMAAIAQSAPEAKTRVRAFLEGKAAKVQKS